MSDTINNSGFSGTLNSNSAQSSTLTQNTITPPRSNSGGFEAVSMVLPKPESTNSNISNLVQRSEKVVDTTPKTVKVDDSKVFEEVSMVLPKPEGLNSNITDLKQTAEKVVDNISKTVTKELAKVTKQNQDSSITVIEKAKYDVDGKGALSKATNIYYTIKTKDKINLNNVVNWYNNHHYSDEFSLSDLFSTLDKKDKVKTSSGVELSLTKNEDGTYNVTTSRTVTSSKFYDWFNSHVEGKYKPSTIITELNKLIQEQVAKTKTKTTKPTTAKVSTTTTTKTNTSTSTYKDILMNYEEADVAHDRLNEVQDILKSSCNRISQLTSDIALKWQGSASRLFVERVEEYVSQIRRYRDYIEEKANTLNLCKKSYKDFDDEFGRMTIK